MKHILNTKNGHEEESLITWQDTKDERRYGGVENKADQVALLTRRQTNRLRSVCSFILVTGEFYMTTATMPGMLFIMIGLDGGVFYDRSLATLAREK